jgi:hypothetical protein
MDTGRELAQKMAYCLQKGRVIELIGRQGRANLYRVPKIAPDNRTDDAAGKRHSR